MDRRFFYSIKPCNPQTQNFLAQFTVQAYGSKAIQRWGTQYTGGREKLLCVLWGLHDPVLLNLAVPARTEVRHNRRHDPAGGFNPLTWRMEWSDARGVCTLQSCTPAWYEL